MRLRELIGKVIDIVESWLMLLVLLFVAISMLSHSQSDISTNVAGAGTSNVMGPAGAIFSDIMFQFFGISAFLLAPAMCYIFSLIKTGKKSTWKILTAFLIIPIFSYIHQAFFPHQFAYFPNSFGAIACGTPFFQAQIFKLTVFLLMVACVVTFIILKIKKIKLWAKYFQSKKKPKPRVEKQSTVSLRKDEHHLPPIELLDFHKKKEKGFDKKDADEQSGKLSNVLDEFGIKGEIVNIHPGPVVTLYELQPAAGIKSNRVISLADDIARSMSAFSARVAAIPGKNVIGIELSNPHKETVYLSDLIASKVYNQSEAKIPLALGKDISGYPVITDLSKMPHLLVAGTTGSGKSVGINSMILSILYQMTPKKCKFIMIDPKMLELSVYDGIPHLLTPVVTDPKQAILTLKWVVQEMENRYRLMSQIGVRNIEGYNQRVKESSLDESAGKATRKVQVGLNSETGKPIFETQEIEVSELPFIVVIVDEMADLMIVAGKELEIVVQRLAQMARAAGIHLIMATQRPSVDVITGTIKANFPTRISFQVTSRIDSRTILGEQGAEQLLGQGDMLYMASGGRIIRVHGPFVSDSEIEKVVSFLREQGEPQYIDTVPIDDSSDEYNDTSPEGDPLYRQAVEIIRRDKKASTSYLQRQMQIGYNRAARIIDQMENEGLLSKPNHVGKREILFSVLMFFLSFAATAGPADMAKYEKYLSSITRLKAKFRQVSSQGTVDGEIFIKKPGNALIKYNDSDTKIIANNSWLVFVKDGNATYMDLKSSPLYFLLQPNTAFSDSVKVLYTLHSDGHTQIVVAQKDDPESGKVTLYFSDSPISLVKWSIESPSKEITEVTLSDVQYGIDLSDEMFIFKDPRMQDN